MTQDEIIEMPEYLNAAYEGDDLYTGDQVRKLMKLVAAAAASKEREACAKFCEIQRINTPATGEEFAAAIRARRDVVTYGETTSRGEQQ